MRNEAECGDTLINENRFLAFMKSERRGESQEGEHPFFATITILAIESVPSVPDSGHVCKAVYYDFLSMPCLKQCKA